MQIHEGQLKKSFITSQGMPGIAGGAALLPWTAFPCTQLAGYKCTQQTGPAKLLPAHVPHFLHVCTFLSW